MSASGSYYVNGSIITDTINSASGSYASGGFSIFMLSGGNVLKVNLPNSSMAQGLSSGMLFIGRQGATPSISQGITTIDGVQCTPVYAKI